MEEEFKSLSEWEFDMANSPFNKVLVIKSGKVREAVRLLKEELEMVLPLYEKEIDEIFGDKLI